MYIDYKKELEIMRAKYKKHKVKPLKLTKPYWVPNDPINKIYTDMPILLESGEVYYAALIQANEILFQKKPFIDCPGNVLFSTSDIINENPFLLQKLATFIYSFKNTDEAPASIKRLVESITDEMERLFNVPISLTKVDIFNSFPVALYGNDTAFYTTVMFFRDYLPTGVLRSGILPIVAAPDKTDISIILPKKYWSKTILKLYRGNKSCNTP